MCRINGAAWRLDRQSVLRTAGSGPPERRVRASEATRFTGGTRLAYGPASFLPITRSHLFRRAEGAPHTMAFSRNQAGVRIARLHARQRSPDGLGLQLPPLLDPGGTVSTSLVVRPRTRGSFRAAFTLVELLVVIANLAGKLARAT